MKRFDQINVIPFIDIMLVLLAIVLTTASFIATGMLDIDLPSGKTRSTQADTFQKIEISINNDNQFLLDDQLAQLDLIKTTLSKLNKETRVILRVDKRVKFEHFVTIIDELKQHQLNHLSIITRQN